MDEPTAASIINAGDLHLFSPQGDGERLWFGGSTGAGSTEIYLYTQAHGLQKVFTDPRPNESVAAVGFCRWQTGPHGLIGVLRRDVFFKRDAMLPTRFISRADEWRFSATSTRPTSSI